MRVITESLGLACIVALVGTLILLPLDPVERRASHSPVVKNLFPEAPVASQAPDLLTQRFQQAVTMLHAGQYDFAIKALHEVIKMRPKMPEAYVNLGYAMIGLEKYPEAKLFFDTATEIKPYQANAYWGLAQALEKMGDLKAALGAMRTFIHLTPPDDPFVRKARSALWEWDTILAKGPLPEAEKAFLKKGTRQWMERNGFELDVADTNQQVIVPESP